VNKKNGNPKYTMAQNPASQVGRDSFSLWPITIWARRFSRNFFNMTDTVSASKAGECQ
jgi:hypothetical protein